MKLQSKLITGFGLVTIITLAVAAVGYWQAQRLAGALYEVGVVRLPSIQGLDMMSNAMTVLEASERALLQPGMEYSRALEEMERQNRAWDSFDRGWRLYEPLPQTDEESVKWRAFVPAAKAWRADHERVVALATARPAADRQEQQTDAMQRNVAETARLFTRASVLLGEITALNYAIVENAKQNSVASYQDMALVRQVMLISAAAGVLGAIGLAVLLGRRWSRPVVEISEALSAVAHGDLSIQVSERSQDEIGRAAGALNSMVAAMRNSQAMLRVLSDNLPSSMLYQAVLEQNGLMRFHYLSAAVNRIHGISADDALRDPTLIFQQVLEEDRPRLAAAQQASLQSMGVFNVEIRIRRADGAVRWMHICSQPRRLPDGRTLWDGIETDITEGKRAGEALRESEERFRSAMLNSAIGVALVSADGHWLEVNPALCRITGYTREEMLQTSFPAITHPEDVAADLEGSRRLLAGEIPTYGVEKRYIHRDGHIVWVQVNVSLVRDNHGHPLNFITQVQDISERRHAELALRESEGRFRAVVSNSTIGMAILSPEFKTIAINPSQSRILGYTEAETVARNPIDSTHPDDKEATRRLLARLKAGEIDSYEVEKRYIHKSGRVVWAHVAMSTMRDTQGRPQYYLAQIEDITERKLAELELRESEARFRAIVFTSTIGMAILDITGRTLAVNPALANILGYTDQELLAIDPIRTTHPADEEISYRQLGRLLAGEIDSYELEKRYLHKSGRVVWGHVTMSTMRDTRGQRQHFMSQIEDITERKLAAMALAESAERLRIALEVSRLGVWRRNLVTGVAEWDERMYEIFGLEAGREVPSYEEFIALVVPEDRTLVDTAWRNFVAGTGAFEVQFHVRGAGGELRHISAQATLHRDEAGQPVWIVGVDADLTELTRATEETGRLREQLRQAHKMETLGTLAAGVAHDFNNLLTGINGFIDLGAASLPADHEAVELLRQARRGATSARDLVRRILAFSRRIPDQERQLVPLAILVQDTAPLITAGLSSQVTLSLRIDSNVPPVRADLGQIQQVLLNLCVNGAHAIGARSGSIQIGLVERRVTESDGPAHVGKMRAGNYACLSVSDTGCGMTPEIRARIFEPFFTTKKSGEGTGLGLAMVQDIILEHDGFVLVKSQPDQGTTFEIYLPTVTGDAAGVPPEIVRERVRGKGERIMVLDDEPSITQVARQALEQAGYTPEEFNSSPEAWTQLTTSPERYELLLIDYQMPDLTGVELAARVRHATSSLPIIIMTARSGDLDLTKLQELGGVSVLQKPFDLSELVARVNAALQTRSPGDPAASATANALR